MAISGFLKALGVVTVGAALLCNLPTRLWLTAERATVRYLADTSLQTVDESQRQFKVNRTNKCILIIAHQHTRVCDSVKATLSVCLTASRAVVLQVISSS